MRHDSRGLRAKSTSPHRADPATPRGPSRGARRKTRAHLGPPGEHDARRPPAPGRRTASCRAPLCRGPCRAAWTAARQRLRARALPRRPRAPSLAGRATPLGRRAPFLGGRATPSSLPSSSSGPHHSPASPPRHGFRPHAARDRVLAALHSSRRSSPLLSSLFARSIMSFAAPSPACAGACPATVPY